MLTKLTFPHQEDKKKALYTKYMENKVKNSPLNSYIKPDIMIFKDTLPGDEIIILHQSIKGDYVSA